MMKERRPFFNKEGHNEILPFEKMKEQRMRERVVRLERVRRALELRRYAVTTRRLYQSHLQDSGHKKEKR